MFGGGSSTSVAKTDSDPSKSEAIDSSPSPDAAEDGGAGGAGGSAAPVATPAQPQLPALDTRSIPEEAVVGELPASDKRNSNGNLAGAGGGVPTGDKKRRSSGVGSKASSLFASAKNSLSFGSSKSNADGKASDPQTPLQKLGKQDPALAVPQGQHNNSAGESMPGPRSTFRVGVWEDRNKKCRRTMEDTHAFLYNFLPTPAPAVDGAAPSAAKDVGSKPDDDARSSQSGLDVIETDNGYFAIFDGHAGSFAADWCGKKLHVILEDVIRKHPNTPIPELLDMTFTSVDAQLEKLPSKSSGCTAAIAVLRWEDRVPNDRSVTGSQSIAPAAAKVAASSSPKAGGASTDSSSKGDAPSPSASDAVARLRSSASRHRVLYTANVGDARIVLCRNGKALRLSYDHKGSDENEGKRIANAGGLIVNNRVNGVLAVTRALGDAYMKELVTGHPYTTETVIVPDTDEFIIIACDGVRLWGTSGLFSCRLVLTALLALGRVQRPGGRRHCAQRRGPLCRVQDAGRPCAQPV
jgi:protein phosphatase PTC1